MDLSGVVWTIGSHYWIALIDYRGNLELGASRYYLPFKENKVLQCRILAPKYGHINL